MEVRPHEAVRVAVPPIPLDDGAKVVEELSPIFGLLEERFVLVRACGNVVHRIGKVDARLTRHGLRLWPEVARVRGECVTSGTAGVRPLRGQTPSSAGGGELLGQTPPGSDPRLSSIGEAAECLRDASDGLLVPLLGQPQAVAVLAVRLDHPVDVLPRLPVRIRRLRHAHSLRIGRTFA